MTYDEFVALLNSTPIPQGWRKGQFAFNKLYELRPDLSEQIRSDPYLDPFYNDHNLPMFHVWLQQHWGA